MELDHRIGRDSVRCCLYRILPLALLCGVLSGCGAEPVERGNAAATGGSADEVSAAPAGKATAKASHEMTVSGDLQLAMRGDSALAGARYGRYHLSFSGQPDGAAGAVVVSLARAGADAAQAGTYSLGEQGDFDGNIEIHPGPDDYGIENGELVITSAAGDVLEGRYVFSARERGGDAAIHVEGNFRTRPAG